MKIRIVTDSSSDISPELAKELNIEVVPSYVRFGNITFKDGVDLSPSKFYSLLAESSYDPVTSASTPQDFADIYSRLSLDADGIVSIHTSSRLSHILKSAHEGSRKVHGKHHVEFIDSHYVSIGLALAVIAAATAANAGENLKGVVAEAQKAVSEIDMLGFLETMKYAAKGGRADQGLIDLSSAFQVKPMIAFKDGWVTADGLVKTYSHGIDRLCKFVEAVPKIRDLGISYSTNPDRLVEMKKRLGSVFPEEKIYVQRIGATFGAHSGPDATFVAVRRIG